MAEWRSLVGQVRLFLGRGVIDVRLDMRLIENLSFADVIWDLVVHRLRGCQSVFKRRVEFEVDSCAVLIRVVTQVIKQESIVQMASHCGSWLSRVINRAKRRSHRRRRIGRICACCILSVCYKLVISSMRYVLTARRWASLCLHLFKLTWHLSVAEKCNALMDTRRLMIPWLLWNELNSRCVFLTISTLWRSIQIILLSYLWYTPLPLQ